MNRTNYAFCKMKKVKYLVQKAIEHSKTTAGGNYSIRGNLLGWGLMALVAHLSNQPGER